MSKIDKISVSIITATYNREQNGCLEKVVKNIQNQLSGTYDYEHIIIDDGSVDNTKQLVKRFIAKDPRIKYFYQKNQGAACAYKYGIEKATKEYITFLDSDDLLTENSLKVRTEYLSRNPEVLFLYARAEVIDDTDRTIHGNIFQSENIEENQYLNLLVRNYIHGGTPILKAKLLKSLTWPKWLTWSQDYYMWLEILRPENKVRAEFLDKIVYRYRQHNNSYTVNMSSDMELNQKQVALDDKIRSLHHIDCDTKVALDIAKNFEQLYRNSSWDNWMKDEQIKSLKEEVKKQSQLIDQILNSKGWKTLEKIRELVKRK